MQRLLLLARKLLRSLTPTLTRKVLILILFGYRMEAISILGREVMNPRGLIGLGYDTIDYCGPELATVCPSVPSTTPQSNIPGPPRICILFALPYPSALHPRQRPDRSDHLPPFAATRRPHRRRDIRLHAE